MGSPRVTPEQKREFSARLKDGWTIADAARFASVSYPWAKAYAKGLRNSSGRSWAAAGEAEETPQPVALEDLGEIPLEALEDITLFARLYFGAVVMPWQVEATGLVSDLLDTPDEEYLVINCPPGSGKSTFFTKILPAWLTCKRRHIRGLIGSASMSMAKQYVGELRDILASPVPLSQPAEAIKRGYAVSPERCLVSDFGVFKATERKWASDAFFVEQHGGALFGAKEPTWQAFGRGSVFIGARVDFCIWDDLYDPDQYRSEDSKSDLRSWFDKYAETRVEPGGLFVLQGQRFESNDIYRYALDKQVIEFDASGEETGERRPKYHHVKFQAHYEDRCKKENHAADAVPYPEGCLLFPKRLPFPKLRAIQENDPEGYEVVYQQGDTAPGGVLVDKLWVNGGVGVDEDGYRVEFPGCWDKDRRWCELPPGLSRPVISVVTADPSPTRYWAIQWWVIHPETQQRFLMDTEKRIMDAPDFVEYLVDRREYTGLMVEWQQRSVEMGVPITHWIVEQNAAQRFMQQYDFCKKWMSMNNVSLVPHETGGKNKNDPKIGVTSLGPHWKHGRVRLPGSHEGVGRMVAARLIAEVTRYRKDGRSTGTDDQVMAQWFLEVNMPQLELFGTDNPILPTPSWVRESHLSLVPSAA